MEISFPKYPKFKIYADTETFTLIPPTAKPWEEPDTKKRNEILRSLAQIPWLLVWTNRSIRQVGNKYKIEGDWFIHHTHLTDNNFELFFDFLRRIYANRHIPVINFHNASYDITCLCNIWRRLDPDLLIYFYTKPGNYKFLMGAMESPKYKFKAQFGDTMLYLNDISVDEMGSELGYPKLKGVPYAIGNIHMRDGQLIYIDTTDGQTKTFPFQTYLEYAERDVEIIRRYDEYLEKVKDSAGRAVIDDDEAYDNYFKKNIWDRTQASHAKSLFNAYLRRNGYNTSLDDSFRYLIDKESYEYISISNMGGFTSYNKNISIYRCKPHEEIRYLDMNSMYPYTMTEGLPWKNLYHEPPVDKPYVTWKLISVHAIKWNSLMDFNRTLPVSEDRITPKDSENPTKFYVTEEYLEMMRNNTDVLDITVHHTVYQEKTNCVKKFVEDLYRKRVLIKRELEELEKQPTTHETLAKKEQLQNQQRAIKIILNSTYGKFCERPHHTQCFYSNLTDNKYLRYPLENPVYRTILTGCYIIYRSRLLLLEKIIQCAKQGWTVLYADTDSVIFVCPKNADHTPIFGTDEGWLGQWKPVGKAPFNVYVNSGVKKKYFLLDESDPTNFKNAMSGVNKEFINALETQLKRGNHQTIEDIIFIFDPNNNVLLKKLKKNKVRTHINNQTIIYESDYTFNGKKTINAELSVSNGEYKLIKYEQQH